MSAKTSKQFQDNFFKSLFNDPRIRRERRARLFIDMYVRINVDGDCYKVPILVSRVTGKVYCRGVNIFEFHDLSEVNALDPCMTGVSFAELTLDISFD